MSKLTIIKLGLIPAIIVWWVCVFEMLDRMDTPSDLMSITLIMTAVMPTVCFAFLCRWSRFRYCTGGRWTQENIARFEEYSLAYGVLQVLTHNRFSPRTNKSGQEIDDAGMVRACLFDSLLEFTFEVFVTIGLMIQVFGM